MREKKGNEKWYYIPLRTSSVRWLFHLQSLHNHYACFILSWKLLFSVDWPLSETLNGVNFKKRDCEVVDVIVQSMEEIKV